MQFGIGIPCNQQVPTFRVTVRWRLDSIDFKILYLFFKTKKQDLKFASLDLNPTVTDMAKCVNVGTC